MTECPHCGKAAWSLEEWAELVGYGRLTRKTWKRKLKEHGVPHYLDGHVTVVKENPRDFLARVGGGA